MKRLLASVATFAVLVGVMLAPALFWGIDTSAGDEANEPTTIRLYDADFTVSEGGDLAVVETLSVSFPTSDRHGIFRFFDRIDESVPEVRRIVEDVEVTMDGGDIPVDHTVEKGRYDVYRIGDPDTFLSPGLHVFEIRYTVPTVLAPGGPDVSTDSQFYWQLIPEGWAQDIQRADLTVTLPAPAEEIQCVVGTDATGASPCVVSGEETTTVRVTANGIDDHTPVTLIAGQDVRAPEPAVTRPWAPRFDQVAGPSPLLLALVGLVALGAGALGLLLAWRSVEHEPAFPLMYAPPEGIGPAQASYILREKVDRTAYVASLLYAAERGAVHLDRSGQTWTITDARGPEGWEGLDEVTYGLADILPGPRGSFTADPRSVEAGRRLKKEIAAFTSQVRGWASQQGLLSSAGAGILGAPMVLGAALAVVLITFFNPFTMTLVGLPFAALAAGAVPLLQTGASTKRTAAGRDLWSRVGGFRRVLSTPSSQDRFDFSGREDLYTKYIPWAVAFDCADAWAEKYRVETGAEPPAPGYFVAYGAHGSQVDSMVRDFESTVGSAISSYQATQRSSSGGGGGFSGGGGGGGGGGGSW